MKKEKQKTSNGVRKFIVAFLLLSLLFPIIACARMGVGVGVGKIEVDEPLMPGMIHILPYLPVINTGTEPSYYEVSIQYFRDQPELMPPKEWFSFEPALFHLEPGQVKNVAVRLTLPTRVVPGDYFAFLEAGPVVKDVIGDQVRVGIAAASKLYFTVAPANIWQAIYYRFITLWTMYSPWTWIVLIVIIALTAILLFRKYFDFQIGLRKKEKIE